MPKRGKKQRKDCRIQDRAVEDSLVEFFRENEMLWNSQKTDYRNKAKRQRILETKATELEIGVDHLWTWFKSLRDMFTRLDKKKSGEGQQQLTERETWIKAKFGFFHCAVNHRSKPVRSSKAIIAQSQGDLDEAERAAAEERVDVDEFADPVPVVERQPTPALSVSSDMETLRRKPVTERTTYAAYVKSVLLGLSLKDFRRARKGFNKVLRPFCDPLKAEGAGKKREIQCKELPINCPRDLYANRLGEEHVGICLSVRPVEAKANPQIAPERKQGLRLGKNGIGSFVADGCFWWHAVPPRPGAAPQSRRRLLDASGSETLTPTTPPPPPPLNHVLD
ncbi:hypothetical protein NHX12_027223 [Muraenolepis orangiensis]|uniref:MADF domain-containing protein n=1 Tax=Muraenolepis orangiensis TaxID=630683 RepID=A0A9Q0IP05_9TELE|nr:hypothetical protein NHX12_027223 [Muraenolepis orangiensis]